MEPDDNRRAVPNIPGILQLGSVPRLPELVLQESTWSTETVAKLLAATGHDWTPDVRPRPSPNAFQSWGQNEPKTGWILAL